MNRSARSKAPSLKATKTKPPFSSDNVVCLAPARLRRALIEHSEQLAREIAQFSGGTSLFDPTRV